MSSISPDTLIALALALALGLLVGMQRERTKSQLGGIRTFPIIALFGAMLALISESAGGWVVAAGLIALAAMLVAGILYGLKTNEGGAGITSAVAALTVYAIGAALIFEHTVSATVVAGILALLLHFKEPLHRAAKGFREAEIQAVFKFALLALVILPLLPNRTFGPYEVLNPFKIWLIVILIVGISLAAYLAYRLVGARTGTLLGGLLGGLISSTATTISYARQVQSQPALAPRSALVILIASTVVYARMLFEIAVVAPRLFLHTAIPLGAMLIFMSLLCLALYRRIKRQISTGDEEQGDNPAQLGAALFFGGLYAVVLFLVAVGKEHFGNAAIYGIAIISGLTDVNAITLSTAELFKQGRIESATAWQVILIASLSNLVFKAGAVALLADRALAKRVALLFGICLLFGLALLASLAPMMRLAGLESGS